MSKSYWKLTDEEYEFIKGEVIHIFENTISNVYQFLDLRLLQK